MPEAPLPAVWGDLLPLTSGSGPHSTDAPVLRDRLALLLVLVPISTFPSRL